MRSRWRSMGHIVHRVVDIDEESSDDDASGQRDRAGGGQSGAGRERRGDEVASRAHVRGIIAKLVPTAKTSEFPWRSRTDALAGSADRQAIRDDNGGGFGTESATYSRALSRSRAAQILGRTTLKVGTGFEKPLSPSSPTGSTSTRSSTAASTR